MMKDGHPYTNENGHEDKALVSDLPEEQQQIVLVWIANNFRPIKSVNYRHTSYGLKHALQKHTSIYLTNNQFKDAMMQCGYYPKDVNDLNWFYRISERSPAFYL